MPCTPVGTLTVTLPNAVLAGNTLICGVQCNSSATITSVKDNLGNSFTLGPSFTNSGLGRQAALYYLPNATAGVTGVVITFSGLSTNSGGYGTGAPHAVLSEWYNIATASPLGTSANSNSSKSLSLTTGTAGDLIYQWGIDLTDTGTGGGGNRFNGTSITPGSGYTLLGADLEIGSCEQYQIQSSAGAIGPSFSTSGSATWGSLALALKAGPGGTAPSSTAMRIVSMQTISLSGANSTGNQLALNYQFPSRGNLLVAMYQSAANYLTAITDGNSNAWTVEPNSNVAGPSGNYSQIAFAPNATTGSTLGSIHFTYAGGAIGPLVTLIDIVNAPSSPFDNYQTASGDQTTNTNLTTTTITPSTLNGIVLNVVAVTWNTLTGNVGGSNYIFDYAVNNLENNGINCPPGTFASTLAEDGGLTHVYNTTTSPLTFTYTQNQVSGSGTNGAGYWCSAAIAFKGPSQ
jgi:hypothetical protein